MTQRNDLRIFINRKAMESPGRQTVAGDDTRKMISAIAQVEDVELRERLITELKIKAKYQFLKTVVNENSELMKTQPEVAWQIAINGTDMDYAVEHDPPVHHGA